MYREIVPSAGDRRARGVRVDARPRARRAGPPHRPRRVRGHRLDHRPAATRRRPVDRPRGLDDPARWLGRGRAVPGRRGGQRARRPRRASCSTATRRGGVWGAPAAGWPSGWPPLAARRLARARRRGGAAPRAARGPKALVRAAPLGARRAGRSGSCAGPRDQRAPLRRRFDDAVGYGPKTLQRVLRFQRFLALAATRPPRRSDLAGLAFAAGYADQAHLTRECTRLAGLPPAALLEPPDPQGSDPSTFVALRVAFQRISPEHRAVVVLHMHFGYTVAETAAMVGVPDETVRSRLRLAKQRLRVELEESRS